MERDEAIFNYLILSRARRVLEIRILASRFTIWLTDINLMLSGGSCNDNNFSMVLFTQLFTKKVYPRGFDVPNTDLEKSQKLINHQTKHFLFSGL